MSQALRNYAELSNLFQSALAPVQDWVKENDRRKQEQKLFERNQKAAWDNLVKESALRQSQQIQAEGRAQNAQIAAEKRAEQTNIAREKRGLTTQQTLQQMQEALSLHTALEGKGISVPANATVEEMRNVLANENNPDTIGKRGADAIQQIDTGIQGTLKQISDSVNQLDPQVKLRAALSFMNDPEVVATLLKRGQSLDDIAKIRNTIAGGDPASAENEVNKLIGRVSKGIFTDYNDVKSSLAVKFLEHANAPDVAGAKTDTKSLVAITQLQSLLAERAKRLSTLNAEGFKQLNEAGSPLTPTPTPAVPASTSIPTSAQNALFGAVGNSTPTALPANPQSLGAALGSTVAPAASVLSYVPAAIADTLVNAPARAINSGTDWLARQAGDFSAALQGAPPPVSSYTSAGQIPTIDFQSLLGPTAITPAIQQASNAVNSPQANQLLGLLLPLVQAKSMVQGTEPIQQMIQAFLRNSTPSPTQAYSTIPTPYTPYNPNPPQ